MTLYRYRLALYGSTGAGKTAFLAALASDRVEHHPKYSCTRVPLSESLKEKGFRGFGGTLKRQEALQAGSKWLDDALLQLEKCELPVPNPPNQPDMLFEFDLTDGDRSWRLEFIDYAGELVDATLADTEKAARLRKRLKDMDGLLVLAPAPWPEQDHIPLDKSLRSLRETFMLLRGERDENALSIPVALLFNKWDRRSELEHQQPQNEWKEMEEFLSQQPPPPQRELLKALEAVVDDTDNFHVFPVSALGECEKLINDDGVLQDGPPRSFEPLQPFGLLEPLVWICQRCDETDLRKLSDRMEDKLGAWWKQILPWPVSLQGTWKQLRQLRHRIPQRDSRYARIRQLGKTLGKGFLTRMLALLFLLATAEGVWDYWHYARVSHLVDNPTSSLEQVTEAVQWLEAFVETSVPFHMAAQLTFLQREEAENRVREILDKWETQYWKQVVDETDLSEQIRKARVYLEKFPNGPHLDNARQIIRKNEFIYDYKSLLKTCNFIKAGNLLAGKLQPNGRIPKDDQWLAVYLHTFWSNTASCLKEKIRGFIVEHRFSDANKLLIDTKRLLSPRLLALEDSNILETMQTEVNIRYDTWLYGQVIRYRGLDEVNYYLQNAPLGCMKNKVVRLKDSLQKKDGKMKFKLLLRTITWGVDNDNISFKTLFNGRLIIKVKHIDASPGKKSSVGESFNFSMTMKDSFKLTVSAQAISGRWIFKKTTPVGRGGKNISIGRICGKIKKGKAAFSVHFGKNTAHFTLFGCPAAVDMPPWKNCSGQ